MNTEFRSNADVLATLPTDTRLAGKTAIVTGSSSGIGEAIARVLAASGAQVVIHGRDAARAGQVADAITRAGGTAHVITADLSASYDQVRDFAHRATAALGGRVDILVNNAALLSTASSPPSDADLTTMLATNIGAPYVLVNELAPAMVQQGGGAIVNIGSWMARTGTAFGALYPATKAAVEQFTRSWAAEYGPQGVRVNTVAPGTTLTDKLTSAGMEGTYDAMSSGVPAGKPVRPVDIAYAVRYLVSDEAMFLHGTQMDVDGGLASTRLKF